MSVMSPLRCKLLVCSLSCFHRVRYKLHAACWITLSRWA